MTKSTRDLLFPVVNEEMTTNKEMAVMKQFPDDFSVKRTPNRTSKPLEGSAGFWRETAIVLYEKISPSAREKLLH